MGAAAVLVDRVSGTRRDLTLNSSATRNALSVSLVDGLIDELEDATRAGVRLVVLRSCVPVFSAGFDLDALGEETDATLLWRFARIGILLETLTTAPFTTIALLQGAAVGAGADLALACDHRIGTAEASFRFPGAGFGVVLGTQQLAMLVGQSQALHLISTNAKLPSDAAHELGVLRIAPSMKDAEAQIATLQEGLDRLPAGAFARLAQAGRPVEHGQPLADLVRSIAACPGLKDRITEFAATARPKATTTTPSNQYPHHHRGVVMQKLIKQVDELVQNYPDEHVLTPKVADALTAALAEGFDIPEGAKKPDPDRYVMYPLYVAPDNSFSIASAVWNVGQGTPVHGHGTWGVVGIYSGQEHELSFTKPAVPDVPLVSNGEHVWRPGEVTVCCTTDDDVHQVRCEGDVPVIGIHIYGGDIATIKRRSYEPETGKVSWFVSTWGEIA